MKRTSKPKRNKPTANHAEKTVALTQDRNSKVCSMCLQDLPISNFHKNGTRFHSSCKSCTSQKKKAKYAEKKALETVAPEIEQNILEPVVVDTVKCSYVKPEEQASKNDSPCSWIEPYRNIIYAIGIGAIIFSLAFMLFEYSK